MGTPYEISSSMKMMDPVYQVVGDANWNSWSKIARLIRHMTWRSLASRYRGSALGFIWTLVNPIMLMFVYTFVFKNIFGQNASDVPFQVYLMTGILAWNFFSTAAIQASVSLVSGVSLAQQIDVSSYCIAGQCSPCKCGELSGGVAALAGIHSDIRGPSDGIPAVVALRLSAAHHHGDRTRCAFIVTDAVLYGSAASHRSFLYDVVLFNSDSLSHQSDQRPLVAVLVRP